MKRNFKEIMTLAVLAVFGLSTMASAGMGFGHNNMGMGGVGTGSGYNSRMGMGNGWGSAGGGMCGYGPGNGYSGNLSPDQLYQLDMERTDFLRETEDLRKNLYAMDLELRNELAKQNPDAARISGLKLEISNLQSELYQKSLDYDTRVRHEVPGYNGGYLGHCPMMGYMW